MVIRMITSFQHRGLKRFYERGDRSRLSADMVDRIERILADLDDAKTLGELNLPSYRLHQLSGDRKGQGAMVNYCPRQLARRIQVRWAKHPQC